MLSKLLDSVLHRNDEQRRAEAYSEAIREEAKIGGKLFGPVPQGTTREFFCLDPYTWVWHEEWTDDKGTYQVRTTRYDVRPNGIYKAQLLRPSSLLPITLRIRSTMQRPPTPFCGIRMSPCRPSRIFPLLTTASQSRKLAMAALKIVLR
jgi:hypothetical protein